MSTPKGLLQVVLRHKKTKEVAKSYAVRNVVVYQAGDLLAKLIGGDASFAPTHIYGEHASHPGNYTEGVLPPLTADKEDTLVTLRTSPRITTDAEEPIISRSYSRTTEFPVGTPVTYWNHNQVTLMAVLGDPALNNRIVVGAGLVCVVNGVEYLFAHQYHNGIVKLSNFELVYLWTMRST